MLTLKRLTALADVYGADLRRWPESERAEAAELSERSPVARRVLQDARSLDHAIAEAGASTLQPSEQAASLARVRLAVAARIAAPLPGQRHARWSRWMAAGALLPQTLGYVVADPRLSLAGMTIGSGCALVAGLWIGAMHAPLAQMDLMALLQPRPVPGLGW